MELKSQLQAGLPVPTFSLTDAPPTSAEGEQSSVSSFYVKSLDGLRAVAFLLVFVHHFQPITGLSSPLQSIMDTMRTFGWLGVDLFFCLSAFLITEILRREFAMTGQISLRRFYFRRTLRIWPLYYAFVFYALIGQKWLSGQAFAMDSGEMRVHGVPYFLFLGNLSTMFHGYHASLGHLWSVCVEEQFYLIWPLVLIALLRCSWRARITCFMALFLADIVVRHFVRNNLSMSYLGIWTNTLAHMGPFLAGAGLSFIWQSNFVRKLNVHLVLAVGLLLLAAVIGGANITDNPPRIVWMFTASGVGFALILLATLKAGPLRSFFSWGPLAALGRLTYGLYVFHVLAIGLARGNPLITWAPADPALAWCVSFFNSFAICLALATVSYFILELPFLRLKERFAFVRKS